MPIHEVGYRCWNGELGSPFSRWTVIAGAGVRMMWRSHWLRRMLLLAWLPAASMGLAFFLYEQALKRPETTMALKMLLKWLPHSESALRAWQSTPTQSRHAVWSLFMMTFFRYPQGTLMVLVVGLIAPPLIARDFRSRAFLLYFSRPLTPVEYILGKSMVLWCYLAAITTLPALVLYVLGVLLSPDISVVSYTWDLPLRILAASFVLITPTTALALCFSSMTTESRYAGFAWFTMWIMGWVAYAYLQKVGASHQWSMISLYHMLGRVQAWIFGLAPNVNDVSAAATLLAVVTLGAYTIVLSRVYAPMRI